MEKSFHIAREKWGRTSINATRLRRSGRRNRRSILLKATFEGGEPESIKHKRRSSQHSPWYFKRHVQKETRWPIAGNKAHWEEPEQPLDVSASLADTALIS